MGFWVFHIGVCDEGWLPREGYCYEASTECQPWTVANSTCEQRNSSLASIHNELEAHFVGVLSSDESWIGLYWNGDGFDWTDGTTLDYLYWMKGQQGNYTEYNYRKMCVNELGMKDIFRWNGSLCKDCRSYICKKGLLYILSSLSNDFLILIKLPLSDLDECETGGHNCSKNEVCTNNDGSFSCQCKYGYVGKGRVCGKKFFTIAYV